MDTSHKSPEATRKPHRPFRRAVLRGLAILMPPLLTIAVFIWAWSVIETSVLRPIESLTSDLIAVYTRDDRGQRRRVAPRPFVDGKETITDENADRVYTKRDDGKWVGYYTDEHIRETHLQRRIHPAPVRFGVPARLVHARQVCRGGRRADAGQLGLKSSSSDCRWSATCTVRSSRSRTLC